jgi:hypothetical protein
MVYKFEARSNWTLEIYFSHEDYRAYVAAQEKALGQTADAVLERLYGKGHQRSLWGFVRFNEGERLPEELLPYIVKVRTVKFASRKKHPLNGCPISFLKGVGTTRSMSAPWRGS